MADSRWIVQARPAAGGIEVVHHGPQGRALVARFFDNNDVGDELMLYLANETALLLAHVQGGVAHTITKFD